MSLAICGCSVLGGINPTLVGTKGISQQIVRPGPGHVRVTFDYPINPRAYAVAAQVTSTNVADSTIVCFKQLDVTGTIALVEVRTFAGGIPADLDFDLNAFVYDRIP